MITGKFFYEINLVLFLPLWLLGLLAHILHASLSSVLPGGDFIYLFATFDLFHNI